MFTGLIEATAKLGEVKSQSFANGRQGKSLAFALPSHWQVSLGDSIAVNGVCLTVANLEKKGFASFDVSDETLSCTNLADLQDGSLVNLERAMQLGDRLGGHLLSGHVDAVGLLQAKESQADGHELSLELSIPASFRSLVIAKGSIALDGISLTINQVLDKTSVTSLFFWIIPTTVAKTTIGTWSIGQKINVEFDMLGKYIQRGLQKV